MARGFELVEEAENVTPLPVAKAEQAGISVLSLALKALSQRAILAVADLFCLLTVGSAWLLWHAIPQPDVYQIVSLSIYAVFVLAANWIVRSKR